MNEIQPETLTSQIDCHRPSSQRIGDYSILRRVAMGGQANLYLAVKDELYYVLKMYNAKGKDIKFFQKEVDILKKLNGRGIVPIQSSIQNVQFVNENAEKIVCNLIVMPFYENGDLLEWIYKYCAFNEQAARFCFKKLLQTFLFIAQKQIYHRDIKPENILLDQNYQPLVMDFGLSAEYQQKSMGFVGSARYVAPEVLKQKEYTAKSEIYSLGILLFFMLTGNYPYSVAKINQANYRLIFEKKYTVFWSNFEKKTNIVLSNSFKEMFMQMISPDPAHRPDLDGLLQFNWLKENQMAREQYLEYMTSKRQRSSI